MSADGDALFARAAAVLAHARVLRTETQRIFDSGSLERLQRELTTKMGEIDRLIDAAKRALPKKRRSAH